LPQPAGSETTKATLSERLLDWTDWDYAEWHLGVVLGLWEDGPGGYRANKHIFWTDNVIGNRLHRLLLELSHDGVLEMRDEDTDPDLQFRWRRE
jgi:hypothetical protein